MNVFYLDEDVKTCAEYHCDKHVVKMIIEYAQLLSTAHRMLDGEMYLDKTKNGRNIKRWHLDSAMESDLYKASHVNHPSAIWARKSKSNYNWLYRLFANLCDEYTHRYGKIHLTDWKLRDLLRTTPKNIDQGGMTVVPQAMPDHCKMSDPIRAYRNYYRVEKAGFAKWTNREIPSWYK